MKKYYVHNYLGRKFFFLYDMLPENFVQVNTEQEADIIFFGWQWLSLWRAVNTEQKADRNHANILFHPDKTYVFFAPEHFYPGIWQADFSIIYGKKPSKRIFHSMEIMAGNAFIKTQNLFDKIGINAEDFTQYPKTRFCNFVYSNKYTKFRNDFYKALHAYKPVDSLGKYMKNMNISKIPNMPNNLPKCQFNTLCTDEIEKLYILRNYKFTIAMENGLRPYSFSEKVTQALAVGSIPIYWGASDIDDFVNKDAYINAHDFENIDDLVAYVLQVDADDALYQKYRNANPYISDLHDKMKKNNDKLLYFIATDIANYNPKNRSLFITLCRIPVVNKILQFGYNKFWKLVSSKRKRFGGW